MGATITVPAEFRELFDSQVGSTRACIADDGCQFTSAELAEADELVATVAATDPSEDLVVKPTAATLVTLLGCTTEVGCSIHGIAERKAPNDPECRREAQVAMRTLTALYEIAADIPQGVRA